MERAGREAVVGRMDEEDDRKTEEDEMARRRNTASFLNKLEREEKQKDSVGDRGSSGQRARG